ncbi:MAG: membrane protein insertase YidC [Pyrinomonadaceae bacterium]|nr:membrane protein insertase YidC [Acidobacteriota bacterium]MBK7932856.1 membrane protein insertase YidC [Acidobacteriota bacterium]MBP7377374.1 membrane protein insertase YidC [Pyrinomonadaceae bacterium]
MENPGSNNSQSRFLIAMVLAMAVLFGWQYFFAPKPPVADPNAAANTNTAQTSPAQPTPAAPTAQTPADTAAVTPDITPNKLITIKSPLYEVTLDSKGAVATSWILIQNKSPKEERPLWADGSNSVEKKPLQLISNEALAANPREVPFRLTTDDTGVNGLINERNYAVTGADGNVELAAGQERTIEFKLTDANGLDVTKTFVFRADSYVADLSVKLTKGGQPMPNAKLLIGASIGDQAIPHHNFYHIEPEAVAFVNDSVYRNQGASLTFDANNKSSIAVPGNIDWAGVGDAYFAMAAIPAQRFQGLEFHATKYEFQTVPFYDGIFSWITRSKTTSEIRHLITAYVPITTDGTPTKIFTGTKDYFALSGPYSESLSQSTGRRIELVDLINFSNYSWIRPITKTLSIPIIYSLNFFNNLTNNYGVAIIVFTFLFYMLLFPLRWSQSKSFKKASGNAPKMKEIQDKIKDLQKKGVPNDDPRMRQLQMDQLKMTKDALPIGGCLPMLLQFPLLIAFYTAVTIALDLRQASFLWLPDLSAADPWHLLEFAFALSMILSMKFTPQAAVVTPEQAMQQKLMTYLMPIMMLWVMWSAPSGLLLYWFFGNIVSFGQQMVINHMNKTNIPPGTQIVDTVPTGAKQVKPKLA